MTSSFSNSDLYTLEAANMYCGSEPQQAGGATSLHLQLSEVKLPGWTENYADHRAGGAPVAIEIETFLERLECTFMCAGWQPQVQELIASWSAQQNQFYMYGLVRERAGGNAIQVVANIRGRLGRADPENWVRGNLQHWQYSVRGILSYKLVMGGETIYDWDFLMNRFFINGFDQNAQLNGALAIPAQAAGGGGVGNTTIIGA